MDLIEKAENLAGWVPIRVNWHGSEPLIDWVYAGEMRFTEPFFDNTIERLLERPFNLAFRRLTKVDALRLCATGLPNIKPSGFIFHMSRCGSTLVSRMLAALPQNVVISEASPLDWMIRANVRRPQLTDDEHVNWIRWMTAALAQKSEPQPQHFFVKFDAWHTLYFDVIKRAFPEVPWIFLYRNPAEVLVSHERMRGAATIPGVIGHSIDGLRFEDAINYPFEEYPALVLARFCHAALAERDDPNGKFVNYTSLPEFACGDMLRHFGLEYSDDDLTTMKAAAAYNAKAPSEKFTADTEDKLRDARGEIDRIAQKHFGTIYNELEAASHG